MQLETQLEQSKTQAQDRIETFHLQFREMEEVRCPVYSFTFSIDHFM